ncbi:hypothetical protein GH714_020755 [Hevea brasiliensis]|uniref:glucose-6-phosphate 1-epimerase n=1 Tax=Hevea brasiliensis TaxID=3981 RepID=A0A6A6KUV2_HEVBR|nr:hypothetical protein GH714_020755 [Hevea brasiliensis]
MGNKEEGKSSKPDKSSSPAPVDHTNIHVYPDWAAMQAYYGPRVALPPYLTQLWRLVKHPSIYVGPPQPMMPPYGAPYAAVYSHGGVYAHPTVPIGLHPNVSGVPSSPAAATPVSVETPTKSTGNTDRGLMKKLKRFDGLAMSIGNGNTNAESAEGGTTGYLRVRRLKVLVMEVMEIQGSKRSCEGMPNVGGEMRTELQVSSVPTGEVNASSHKVLGAAVASASVSGKSEGTAVSPSMSTAYELRNPPVNSAKTSVTNIPQPCQVLPSEAWFQNERELKRERRKQSNRESARRSRLRKQAETEELAHKVESLTSENLALKSEINQLTKKSEKLRLENASLLVLAYAVAKCFHFLRLFVSALAVWDHRAAIEITKDWNGIEQVVVRNPQGASARVSLHGGQVVSWRNERGEELLFTSSKAIFKPPKAMRGGIPICFPQFGNCGSLEQHGFARNKIWTVDDNPPPLQSNDSKGKSFVDLLLKPSEEDLKCWPHSFEFRVRVLLATNGDLALISRVRNINGKPFSFSFAYHTYLSVSDISIDHERKRTFVIRKEGLPDVVVWNPWEKKSKAMVDFGDEEYKHMVCVDGAAIERPITLKPGEEWTGRLELSVVPSSFCSEHYDLQRRGL